ncbi:recombination regulator RecX [Aerococcaceae bacterium WGS1372]
MFADELIGDDNENNKNRTTEKVEKRYSIYVDEEFVCGIDEEILIQFSLYKGMEVTTVQLEEIQSAENDHRLYSQALNYLSYGLRTEKEILDYLNKIIAKKDQNISEGVIQNTLTRLKYLGYINDHEYAKSYVRTKYSLNSKGPNVIANELKAKGVEDFDIQDALLEYPEEEQVNNIEGLIKKFLKSNKNLPAKMIKNKLYTHLMTKGYDKEFVNEALSDLSLEGAEDREVELIEKEAQIYLRRHQRKYSGYNLKQKISQSLYGRGFNYELIKRWLEEHENLFD